MIKFFRHIRKQLLGEGKTGKYLKYAIGEILLVVIGIIIALQINNWNEQRKANIKGVTYLKGISHDLEKDILLADSILKTQMNSFSVISSIDSVFHRKKHYQAEKYASLFDKPDTLNMGDIFYRNLSFRSINSTYRSLIADGQSGLINNRQLFQEIQQIYNESHERISSTYEAIKEIEARIAWAYPIEKRNWTYTDLRNAKNKKVFADLTNLTEQKYWYAQNLYDLIPKNQAVISLIDKELSND